VYFQACDLPSPKSGTGSDIHDSGVAARHVLGKHVNLLVVRNVVRMVRDLGESDADARRYPDYSISDRSGE
jgi:hypothetical protein